MYKVLSSSLIRINMQKIHTTETNCTKTVCCPDSWPRYSVGWILSVFKIIWSSPMRTSYQMSHGLLNIKYQDYELEFYF